MSDRATNLLLLLNRRCPLRCRYCAMELDGGEMSTATARRAIDLLLLEAGPVELQYFGGEPTLAFERVLDCHRYLRARADRRRAREVLTTNGLGLTPARSRLLARLGIAVLFSLDGDEELSRRQRPRANGGAYPWATLERNLRGLVASGAEHLVNVVATPGECARMERAAAFLFDAGVRRAQFSYALGVGWDRAGVARLQTTLRRVMKAAAVHPAAPEVVNPRSGSEPVLLSPQLVVDVDGVIYRGCSIVLERRWPNLHRAFRAGHVVSARRLPHGDAGMRGQYAVVRAAPLTPGERRGVLRDISTGYAMRRFWAGSHS